jgi:hypothetical protein
MKVNVPHLTVYFNQQLQDRDGKGYCVDHDYPDNDQGRQPGDLGVRFATPHEAGQYVGAWLFQGVKA